MKKEKDQPTLDSFLHIRMRSSLRSELTETAKREGVTVTQLVTKLVEKAVSK